MSSTFIARVAHTDGRTEVKRISFEDARALVGGFVELVYDEASSCVLFVNEDGIRLQLPPNPTYRPYVGVVIAVEPHELALSDFED
jgi:hypothetical protein